MKTILGAFALLTIGFAGDPDTVITRKSHTDAFTMRDREVPARDTTQVIWLRGKDKMRVEEGERVTIVRLDEKKMHLLNTKEKTVTTVALPFDVAKYLPEEMAERMADMPQPKVTVKAGEEKDVKKIKDWNAKKYTVTRSGGFQGGTETVWATTDVKFDAAAYRDMFMATQSMRMGGNAGADEMKKVEGFVVMTESTRSMDDQDITTRQEVVSVESKEGAPTAFDVPADYEKKDFDFRTMMGQGGGRFGRRGGDGGGVGSRPARGEGGAGSRPAGGEGGGGRRRGGRGGDAGTGSKPATPPEKEGDK